MPQLSCWMMTLLQTHVLHEDRGTVAEAAGRSVMVTGGWDLLLRTALSSPRPGQFPLFKR